ncbi:MAG: two-component regulator propeller domain-containing protein [Acidobacteriota bacterium]
MKFAGMFGIRQVGLILLLLCLPCGNLKAQDSDIKFEHFSIEQGLSENTIHCILKDRQGFIWFGSQNGLNRYDGYSFTIFRHNIKDPASLSNNFVVSLYQDRDGMIWIGTLYGGLNKYDPGSQRFTIYRHNPEKPDSLSSDGVRAIYQDNTGTLWVGTMDGLNIFDPNTQRFTVYRHNPNDPNSISSNEIRTIYQDRAGTLWIGTTQGLNKYNPSTDNFIAYHNNLNGSYSFSSDRIFSIYQDSSGTLWIGTQNNGLNRYDAQTESFTSYRNDPKNPDSLSNNWVNSIYQDTFGTLWIGTMDGLNRYDPKTQRFTVYRHNPNDPNSLSSNIIFSIVEDKSGILWVGTATGGVSKYDHKRYRFKNYCNNPSHFNKSICDEITAIYQDRSQALWIGTQNNGLNRYDAQTESFTSYRNDPRNPYSLSNNQVRAIYQDNAGTLWIGTGNGLNRYDPKTQRFTIYRHNPNDPNSLSSSEIRTIYQDRAGTLWIGTNQGLNRYDTINQRFTVYRSQPNNPNSLSDNYITSIYEDNANRLWIGTGNGLTIYNAKDQSFISYRNNSSDPNSISDNSISAIYQDSIGTLWIGTLNGGLNRYDPQSNHFTIFTEKEGLPYNTIAGILEDKQGNLWLSTYKGISKFNPSTAKFKNYDINDGLQSNKFRRDACYKSSSGEMFFGGANGLTRFYPEQIKDNSYIPPIVITTFKIFDQTTTQANLSPFQEGQQERLPIELSYNENFFSFEFVTLNFTNPEKNQYAYKMEGVDKDWIYCGTRRYTSYTNLNPGDYIFRVKGSNNDGLWNETGTAIRIRINPPLWRTWWAYLLYITSLVIIGYASYQYRIWALKRQNLILETKVAEKTYQLKLSEKSAQEANQAKSVFLANMSHELRTPLNAILGFVQIMERDENLTLEQHEHLSIIMRSGKHLLSMINDVLSLSKIEAGKIVLNEQVFDLNMLLQWLEGMFQLRVKVKGLSYICERQSELPQYVYGDDGKLRQVLINLLTNAVKFTNSGSVMLRVEWHSDRASFAIEDTGLGIREDEMARLFEPFTQTEYGINAKEGFGLGLSISRRFIQLMGGEIMVKSELGKGSTFSFTIKLPKIDSLPVSHNIGKVLGIEPTLPVYKILVVDDTPENRILLVKMLSRIGFQVYQAANGMEAITVWQSHKPDLIFMDIRMPVMDGVTATKQIRQYETDRQNTHTVIIALSASVFTENRDTVIAAGCDDFVPKPFYEELILEKIAEHLGVCYLREQTMVTESNSQIQSQNYINIPARLAVLPDSWLHDLKQAVILGDLKAIDVVIEKIAARDKTLHDELKGMARNYLLPEILDLINMASNVTS